MKEYREHVEYLPLLGAGQDLEIRRWVEIPSARQGLKRHDDLV
jgi:hypothetical protein